MKACYDFPKNDVVFPFNLTEYLFADVTPLADIIPTNSEKVPSKAKPEVQKQKEEERQRHLMNTVNKYIEAIDHYGGEATARQIAIFLGYSMTSTGSNLLKMTYSNSILKRRLISRDTAIRMGVCVGKGRRLTLWSYDRTGIIYPLDRTGHDLK